MRLVASLMFLLASVAVCPAGEPGRDDPLSKLPNNTIICLDKLDGKDPITCEKLGRLPRPDCAGKATPQEQIKCLEAAIDNLTLEIPRLVQEEVERKMEPRMYELAR